jgi:hypothetical protein
MMNRKFKFLGLAIMMFSLILAGCTQENLSPDASNGSKFRVSMTDSPADFSALDVEIVEVQAFLEGEGWISLNADPQRVSVLELTNGIEQEIGFSADAGAGVYTMLKIVFGSDNKLTVKNDLSVGGLGQSGNALVTLDLEFEGNKEVIVEIDQEVEAGGAANVLIDFNVAESIIKDGEEYILKPTLQLIEDVSTGISGEVEGTGQAMITLSNGEFSFSTFTDASGKFLLRGMDAGAYILEIMPEADDLTGLAQNPVTIDPVVVAYGEIRSLGKIEVN